MFKIPTDEPHKKFGLYKENFEIFSIFKNFTQVRNSWSDSEE